MSESPDLISAQADRALGAGDLTRARSLLEGLCRDQAEVPDSWLQLAAVCRAQGDLDGALAAVTCALGIDPLHFVALLLKASLLEAKNSPGAEEAYGHALAQRPDGDLPPQLAVVAAHAEARYRAFQEATDRALERALEEARVSPSAEEGRRLARFGSNVARLTRVYHSDPIDYHYPGLTEREFHDREHFCWLAEVEAATDMIENEFARVAAAERVELVPYVQYPQHVPLRQWRELNHSLDWGAIHLLRNGVPVEANVQHCPGTMALLASLPQPHIEGVSPNAMFSLLAPGKHIPPHTGIANTRLVCHLPLIVPEGCWFRVGAEKRVWRRGEAWLFDDTIEHEAGNDGNAARVILIFDLWHPDLGEQEMAGISAMMEAYERRSERTPAERGI